MSYTIQCIHCRAVLKSPAAVPAGKKIRCPKCKETFAAPGEGHATALEKTTALEARPPQTKPPVIPDMEIPEIDDDLVVPDDDQEASGEKKPPTKKKRQADDEDPRAKKKRPRDDDDNDEDEPPRSKKKRRTEEDEYEHDDDDAPRSNVKKKKKKASSPMLLLLLLGGGFVALLACIGCGIAGYFLFVPNNDILGSWETNLFGARLVYTFRADGTGLVEGPAADIHFSYTLKKDQKLHLETRVTRVDRKGPFLVPLAVGAVETFEVTRDGDRLTLRGPLSNMVLRRIK